ncbi:hypothetical protein [Williamsia sp.]|uniref:hypothetical protein n=1 Tax=Williamsia sp. TaxID=1872085 RepID=UPI002F927E12
MSNVGYATLQVFASLRGISGIGKQLNSRLAGESRRAGAVAGESFAEGLRSTNQAERVGRQHGQRYSNGFASGMRSGLNTIRAAFGFISSSAGSVIRNVGTAATVIGLAARAAKMFSLSLLAAATGLKMVAGVGLMKLAGALRFIAMIAGRVATQIARITSAILVLQAVAGVIGMMTRMARAMSMVTIGAAALLGAVSALGPVIAAAGAALVTLGGVAAGAAVAGMSAVGAAVGTLKVGLFGVGDAFKSMGKASTGGGGETVDTAKQIRSAEYQLAQAVEDEADAQKDVGRARDDARKKLRDLDLQLQGAALSEKEAALDLADARDELAAGDFDTGRERERAALRVQEAEHRVAEIQRDNGDLAKEAADARSKGVEGSDEVVAAQERVKDATHQVQQAQESLNEARNPKSSASAGSDPYAEAMAKLSGNAQALVGAVQTVKPAWDDMRKSVQDSLFAGLSDQVQPLANTWMPLLGDAMRNVAGGFNDGAKSAAGWLNSAQGVNLVSTWLGTSSAIAARFGQTLANLLPGFAAIGAGAGQAFEPLTRGLGDSAKRLSDWLVQAQETGKIKEFFESSMATIGQVFTNVSNVVGPLIALFRDLGATSAAGLAPGFVSVGQAIKEATPGLVQMAETLMPALGKVMTNLAPILPTLVHAFTPWSQILAVLAPHIATIVTMLAPFAPQLLALALAVKAMTIAITLYNAVMLVVSNATKIWTGIQIAFNAVMMANPFVLIAVAVVALVAAIILAYKNSETFRNIVQKAWEGIKAAWTAVWDNALKPGFDAFMAALKWIGDAALWLWNSAILPAFNGIKAAIGLWWAGVKIYFDLLMLIWKAIEIAALWLWHNVIEPVFNGIKSAISLWWAGVQIYWDLLKLAWKAIETAAMFLWHNVIEPVFNGIKAAIGLWWAAVQVYWDLLKLAWKGIETAAMFLWHNVIEPVFDGIKTAADLMWSGLSIIFDAIKSGWNLLGDGIRVIVDTIIKPAFEGVKTALQTVGDFFGTIVEGIKTTWDKLKGYVATPINFVIETIWNEGLLKAWNKVAGFLPGLKEMAPLDKVTFAEGGPVPMGKGAKRGKDSVHALMMPDEHVWDVADVAKAGGHGAMYRMRGMVESGMPFTWTPSGVAPAGHGIDPTMPRFKDGGGVAAGTRLSPSSGEGGLQSIAVLAKRLIHHIWPQVKDIGGYRQDPYPEHPSGRALDVMVGNDMKTGDAINGWALANNKVLPLIHNLWRQTVWTPDGGKSPMEDRGSPTQNHMDHVHAWYQDKAMDPNVAPEGLVGADGLSSTDKMGILQKKVKEILDKALDPIKDGIAGVIGTAPPEWLAVPGKALTRTKDAAVEKLFDVVGGLGEKVAEVYDKAKDISSTIASVVSNPIGAAANLLGFAEGGAVPGLWRDKGGLIPMGQSVVTNETGKPEGVVNWDQMELLRRVLEAAAITKPSAPSTTTQDSSRLKTGQELLVDAAGLFRDGVVDFFGVPSWMTDPAGAFSSDDGSNVRVSAGTGTDSTTTSGAQAGNSAIDSTTGRYTPPTYGNGSTIGTTEVPLETAMPDIPKQGPDFYSYEITRAAKEMGLIKRAAIIANGTALVEAGNPLKMWANNAVPESLKFPHDAVGSDHDSVGLFQQRDNGAWGTVADRMDPFRSAGMFLNGLVKLPNWESMDMGVAAQSVQRSGFPDKYAPMMPIAEGLVDKAALFDTGGIWQPGTFGFNGLNEPELVLKKNQWGVVADQTKAVRELVKSAGGRGGDQYITVHGNTAGDIVTEFRREQWAGSAGYGSRQR